MTTRAAAFLPVPFGSCCSGRPPDTENDRTRPPHLMKCPAIGWKLFCSCCFGRCAQESTNSAVLLQLLRCWLPRQQQAQLKNLVMFRSGHAGGADERVNERLKEGTVCSLSLSLSICQNQSVSFGLRTWRSDREVV